MSNSDLEEGDERRAVEMIEDKMESMRQVSYLTEMPNNQAVLT